MIRTGDQMTNISGFNQIFLMFTTLGGVGIINYFLAELTGSLDKNNHDGNTIKSVSILFTAFDAIIYFIVQEMLRRCLSGNWLIIITSVLTIVVAVVLTLGLAYPIHKCFYNLVNKDRELNGLVPTASTNTWKALYEDAKDKPIFAYCYDFNHKKLGWGYLDYMSKDKETNFSLNLEIPRNKEKEVQPEYEEIVKELGTDWYRAHYTIRQHINFKQQFIVIALIKKDTNN